MMRSLFSGVTGLKSHSEGMSSIAHNIANVNTVAFKNAMMLYSDNISQSAPSASGHGITEISQVGLGVSVLTNRTMFQEGSFMQGTEPTDLAISGKGFFGLEKNGVVQYGRAGNFRFTKDGLLVDPNGYSLMSYAITNGVIAGTATPTQLNLSPTGQGYMAPNPTSSITLIENLGSRETATSISGNPFFGLAEAWNGEQQPPLSPNQYAYKGGISVIDAEGNRQSLDVYYDFVGTWNGKNIYQYLVATDPKADGSAKAGSASAGLLAAGTMTFAAGGQLEDMTMFNAPATAGAFSLSSWTPASFGDNGKPVISANFVGVDGTPLGNQAMTINFGIELDAGWRGSYGSAADVAANPAGLYSSPARKPEARSSSSYAGSSGTLNSVQNGYGYGNLTSLTVNPEGYLIGHYSNGQTQDLARIPLYNFINEEGLRHEGGNRYSANSDSGMAIEGFPSEKNFGKLHEATLEESNVDLAKEFATMIMTQRGFQMNSKMVSTSDQMLQKALELKR